MSNPALIPNLLAILSGYPASASVANAYISPALTQNLSEYLNALIAAPYSGDLLVGEAPGHAGCARTGIPLTSERIIASGNHPFIISLRSRLFRSGTQTESTATMVWTLVSTGSSLPGFWNAFPFHPHPVGLPRKNRPPTPAEARFGINVLELIIQILAPKRVFALGRVAETILSANFPHLRAPYIRHPSNGGHPTFVSGMTAYKVV
jgi:uracil-DNA glycosylase